MLSECLQKKSPLMLRTASDRWTGVEESQRTASTSWVSSCKGRWTALTPFMHCIPSWNLEEAGAPCWMWTLLSALRDCHAWQPTAGCLSQWVVHSCLLITWSVGAVLALGNKPPVFHSVRLFATPAMWSDGRVVRESHRPVYETEESRFPRREGHTKFAGHRSVRCLRQACALVLSFEYHHHKACCGHLKVDFDPPSNPNLWEIRKWENSFLVSLAQYETDSDPVSLKLTPLHPWWLWEVSIMQSHPFLIWSVSPMPVSLAASEPWYRGHCC